LHPSFLFFFWLYKKMYKLVTMYREKIFKLITMELFSELTKFSIVLVSLYSTAVNIKAEKGAITHRY
jgi:hypothetical protein